MERNRYYFFAFIKAVLLILQQKAAECRLLLSSGSRVSAIKARRDLCPFVAERDIALDTECQQTATGYNQDLTS